MSLPPDTLALTDRRPDTAPVRVAVIKHGAFGDAVLATGPVRAIRAAHPDAWIGIVTTLPYVGLFQAPGVADAVILDARPKGVAGAIQVARMARRLRALDLDWVYDLQHSDRTAAYFRVLSWRRAVRWSGIARGCSHPHANLARGRMHTVERTAEQLAMAGIAEPIPAFDLDWLTGDTADLVPATADIAVLAPGAGRPDKTWPADRFAQVAADLVRRGLVPVVIGTAAEAGAAKTVAAAVPAALDLTGRTDFGQLAALGRRAKLALGNDTGPMHLMAAVGCPSVVLFGAGSIPAQTAPRGPAVIVLARDRLSDLLAGVVTDASVALLSRPSLS